jgi:hypothetical protein
LLDLALHANFRMGQHVGNKEVQLPGPEKCSLCVHLQEALVSSIAMAKEGPEPSKEKDKDKERYLLWDCAVDSLGDIWMKVYDDGLHTIKAISDEDFFAFVNGAREVVCALASLANVASRTDWQGFGRCLMMLGTSHALLTVSLALCHLHLDVQC